jgi:hypothetical protein
MRHTLRTRFPWLPYPPRGPRALAALALAALAALFTLAACGGTSTPSAAALLKDAQDKFNATNAFHFVLTVDHPGHAQVGGYVITSAQGDGARPDKLSATADVDAGFASVTVQLIIIGPAAWLNGPQTSGAWQPTTQFNNFPVAKFFDSTIGVGALLTQLQNPSAPSDGSANGVTCWKIAGTLDPQVIRALFTDTAATGPLPTTFCIGKSDNRLDSAALTGPLFAGDLPNTVHTFYFSKFDQPVTILPPA